MKKPLILFFLFSIAVSLNGQELLDHKMTSCDRDKRPDIMKDRIIDSFFNDSVFTIKVGYAMDNCSFSPKPTLNYSGDTLYLSLKHNTDIVSYCYCCFENEFRIKMPSKPQTVMFKKEGLYSKSTFRQISKSGKWHRDLYIKGIHESLDDEKDSLFEYSILISVESFDECFGQRKEVECIDTMIPDSSLNVSYTVSSCSEPIPFVKVTVYNVKSGDTLGNLITGKETDFFGNVAFQLQPGRKIVEFRSQEHLPTRDTIEISPNTLLRTNLYLNKPSTYYNVFFSSKVKLSEEECVRVAKEIFLEEGISPRIEKKYPFLK